MYRVGDQVRIIKELQGHEYSIGQLVTITLSEYSDEEGQWYTGWENKEDAVGWWFQEDEIEFVSRSDYREGDEVWIVSNSNGLPGIKKRAILTRRGDKPDVWIGNIDGHGSHWWIKECDIIPYEFADIGPKFKGEINTCITCNSNLIKLDDPDILAECPNCLALYTKTLEVLAA